ncbi:hypothetical protein DL89DRAFT_272538 [Linderina pennispora]|uniref:MalT-like TPR region domain-containing protein n=1 Tax=Linderina pennispora TaxID=61395 RepID=A0A1Y1VTE3_9FUNG|nr:uncharacterized protein DL89DRAFT_272538 [Linderina pennispora]ORX64286.1 hypothetical protein DL89DRAFT_272538 [Linderina pennispora]
MTGIKIVSGIAGLVALGSAGFYLYINHHLDTNWPASPLITNPATRKLLRGAALREHLAPNAPIAYLFLLRALEQIQQDGKLPEESPEVQELVVRLASAARAAGETAAAEQLLKRAWAMVVDGQGRAICAPVVVGAVTVQYPEQWRDRQIGQIADQLGPLLTGQGRAAEAVRVFGAALQAAKRQEENDEDAMLLRQANLVTSLGEAFALHGDVDSARALFESALVDVQKRAGDGPWACLDAVLMYNLAQISARAEEKRAWANSALSVVRKQRDVRACLNCETHVVRLLGGMAELQGDLAEAKKLYDKSLELARRSGTGNIELTREAAERVAHKMLIDE